MEPTWMLRPENVYVPRLFVAAMLKLKLPVAEATPEIAPVALFRLRPFGSEPLETL